MQQKHSPESGYLFEEEIRHEKIGKKEVSSGEALTDLRADLSRFYRLNQKLRSINRAEGAENPAKTVEKLNKMLQARGIGGVNGGLESKAYFVTNGKEVLLVANTVAEGKEVDSREAVYEAFAKIDKFLADPFSKALNSYDERIREISGEYAEGTNDVFRVMDAGMNATGAAARAFGFKGWEGGNKSYERRIDGVKDEAKKMGQLFEKYYAERLESIGKDRVNSGNITEEEREELAILQSQKKRFETLNGTKLASPPWITVELTKFILEERKLESGKNALRFAGGVLIGAGKAVFESAKFILWDAPVFLGNYAFNEKFQKQVNEAVKVAGESIARYSEGKDAKQMVADFFKLLAEAIVKEKAAIEALPPDEQAYRVGEIVGNVLLMLAGPKLAKDFLKSSAFRIKSNAEAIGLANKLGKVTKIDKVRTWDDLESFANTIQKVRGRKDMGADEIRGIIQKLRTGDPSVDVKMLPKAGGLRGAAQALIREGGYLSEKAAKEIGTNWADAIVDTSKAGYRKVGKTLNNFSPERFSKEIAQAGNEFRSLRKVHDAVDDLATEFRTKLMGYREAVTSGTLTAWMSDVKVKFAALSSAFAASGSTDGKFAATLSKFAEKIPGMEKAADSMSSGAEYVKNGAKEVASATTARAKAVLEAGEKAYDSGKSAVLKAEAKIAEFRDRLPGSVRKTLSFDFGFATYETQPGKVRFVRPDGTFLTGADGKALEFKHASQFSKYGAVVTDSRGKFGMIGRDGKFLIEPEYDMIRDLSDERKIVSKNGKYMMIAKGQDGVFKPRLEYDFITEPHQGRAIGVRRLPDGTEVRELLSGEKRTRAKVLTERGDNVHYELVDDFAEDGLAAARMKERSPSGKFQWQILNSDGKHVGMKGSDGKSVFTVEADNPAEALNRYRDWKAELGFAQNAEKAKKAKAAVFAKFPELERDGVRVIETGVDWVYRIQKDTPNGVLKGYVNMKHSVKVEAKFQEVFYSDAKDGFVRVKQEGKWGVMDVKTGEFKIDPSKHEYVSIQVNHEKMGLFEVEVDQMAKKADGTPEKLRQVGLVGPNGQVLIEPKYAYIENPRQGLYRGVTHAEGNYATVVEQSSYFDVADAKAAAGLGTGAQVAGADPLSSTVDAALSANDVRTKLKNAEKAIDPLRRSLEAVTVSKFFASSAEAFGEGKLSFPKYLQLHARGGIRSKQELFQIFEEYAHERSLDFVRNFALTEHRILGRLDYVRVQKKFQNDMRMALEEQFRLAAAGKAREGDRFLAEAVNAYFEYRNVKKRPSEFRGRVELKAA